MDTVRGKVSQVEADLRHVLEEVAEWTEPTRKTLSWVLRPVLQIDGDPAPIHPRQQHMRQASACDQESRKRGPTPLFRSSWSPVLAAPLKSTRGEVSLCELFEDLEQDLDRERRQWIHGREYYTLQAILVTRRGSSQVFASPYTARVVCDLYTQAVGQRGLLLVRDDREA